MACTLLLIINLNKIECKKKIKCGASQICFFGMLHWFPRNWPIWLGLVPFWPSLFEPRSPEALVFNIESDGQENEGCFKIVASKRNKMRGVKVRLSDLRSLSSSIPSVHVPANASHGGLLQSVSSWPQTNIYAVRKWTRHGTSNWDVWWRNVRRRKSKINWNLCAKIHQVCAVIPVWIKKMVQIRHRNPQNEHEIDAKDEYVNFWAPLLKQMYRTAGKVNSCFNAVKNDSFGAHFSPLLHFTTIYASHFTFAWEAH